MTTGDNWLTLRPSRPHNNARPFRRHLSAAVAHATTPHRNFCFIQRPKQKSARKNAAPGVYLFVVIRRRWCSCGAAAIATRIRVRYGLNTARGSIRAPRGGAPISQRPAAVTGGAPPIKTHRTGLPVRARAKTQQTRTGRGVCRVGRSAGGAHPLTCPLLNVRRVGLPLLPSGV